MSASVLTKETEMQKGIRDLSVVDLERQVMVRSLGVVDRSHLGGGEVSLGHGVGGSDGSSEHGFFGRVVRSSSVRCERHKKGGGRFGKIRLWHDLSLLQNDWP